VIEFDFSRGMSIHRLYGHSKFMSEAARAGKAKNFVANICSSLHCKGADLPKVDWRTQIPGQRRRS